MRQIAPDTGAKFRYEYDFAEGWLHTVRVEKIFAPEPGFVYPLCVRSKRACPPEDGGGAGGYERLLEVLAANHEHAKYNALRQWLRGAFDPEAFDPNTINQALRRLK